MRVRLGLGVGILLAVFLAGVLFFFLAQPEWYQISDQVLEFPSDSHLLGTTDLGEDILAQLLQGILPTMAVGFVVGSCCALCGFLLGACAVLGGPFIDRVVRRGVDIMSAIPAMVAIMLIMSVVRPGLISLIGILILFDWHVDVRTFRARIKVEVEHGAVIMAKTFGGSRRYLICRHLMPACYPLLITRFLQTARRAIFKMAGLAFLGVTDPDMVSWGSMLNQSLPYFTMNCWQHWTLPPAMMLFCTLSSLSLINTYVEQRWFLSSRLSC